jgi:putative SOS response-associated peptidase YedK
MCGRFVVSYTYDELVQFLQNTFDIEEFGLDDWTPRYNVAPGQDVLSVIHDGKKYRAGSLKWGLVPSWSKDPNIGYKMINARGETLSEKPSFKSSFESKRCVLLADAFYEWKREGSSKQPMVIQMKDKQMFLLAGLWSSYTQEDGSKLYTTSIVTTHNNELMEGLHDRMPVLLDLNDAVSWLDTNQHDTSFLQTLIQPYDSSKMMMYPVSSKVNKVDYDQPDCLDEIQ